MHLPKPPRLFPFVEALRAEEETGEIPGDKGGTNTGDDYEKREFVQCVSESGSDEIQKEQSGKRAFSSDFQSQPERAGDERRESFGTSEQKQRRRSEKYGRENNGGIQKGFRHRRFTSEKRAACL